MQLPSHGANPQNVYGQLGIEMPNEVYDFSENVNAAGPPNFVEARWRTFYPLIQRYPDPDGEPFLSKVAKFHHVEKENVVLGNGASEIFSVLARRYENKRVIVVHPTFSEYERTLKAAFAQVIPIVVEEIETYKLPMDCLMREMENADALYLCTPNNPTGVMPKREELETLIAHGAKVACEIVLDEAFIDWIDEDCSFINQVAQYSHLLIIRSMTKMYAIPGLRLGYCIASEDIARQLKNMLPHWNINAFAAVIGASCLEEVHYCRIAISHAIVQRDYLREYLLKQRCKVTNSVTNYLCFQLPIGHDEAQFFTYCLAKGVVLRHTKNFNGLDGKWFRVGMKDISAMSHLHSCLNEWFGLNRE
ncbi:MAG: aminotransferase class I/II-fold pyridoxal phosphate-dependent enzyme [Lysinibacillus sp.]